MLQTERAIFLTCFWKGVEEFFSETKYKAAFQFSLQKKHRSKKSHHQPVEMGTQNTDVDYDWIPKETLERDLSKYRNFVIPGSLQPTC